MIPRQIGRYQIRSVLGEGSMGVVYCAHDPQLEREVAIKTIQLPKDKGAAERTRLTQRLGKEARLSARLSHPGIVKVFDVGEEPGGEPYIVLEKIEGAPLASLLENQGALEPEAAVRIMQEILSAIAYAHEQGIIHRDLKPGNIMIQPDGQARIMDFGIAHVWTAAAAAGPELLAGTPRYMSPEQIQGRPVDSRSDLFSLGIIFYEMLAGRKPFPQADFASLREAIINGAYPLLQTVRPDLPPPLYALISRVLKKSPAERFPSARQMLQELRQGLLDKRNVAADQEEQPISAQARREIIDFILQKISRQGDFPTTLQYVSEVTRTAQNLNASAHTIAETILKDFALTNRILRMVNSPVYRGGGLRISTISRAVVLLGVNTVLDVAAGLSVFEHFQNRCNVRELKAQTIQALISALQAREVASLIHYEHTEEAFICGMLSNLGRLIVAFYFPEEHEAIGRLVQQGAMEEEEASRKIMRVAYSELGEAVAQSWQLPENVSRSIGGIKGGTQDTPRTTEQKLQCIVSFSAELSRVTMLTDPQMRQAALFQLTQQFEGRIDLKPRQLNKIIDDAIRHAADISQAMRVELKDLGLTEPSPVTPKSSEDATQEDAPDSSTPPLTEVSFGIDTADPEDSADPQAQVESQRRDFLMQAITEITTALMGPFQINDILMMVLEGMYRGIGFQHVLLSLVNPGRTQASCRFGLGPRIDAIRPSFQFPLNHAGGLPARCILDAREVFIADLDQGNWRGAFAPGFLELLGAKSIALLPIIVNEQPIGLVLADRDAHQPIISKHDLLNLRTLASQAVLAIRQLQNRKE